MRVSVIVIMQGDMNGNKMIVVYYIFVDGLLMVQWWRIRFGRKWVEIWEVGRRGQGLDCDELVGGWIQLG